MDTSAVAASVAAAPDLQDSGAAPLPEAPQDRALDRRLFVAVSLILVLLAALCVTGLGIQIHTYLVEIGKATQKADTSSILSFTRAMDAAIMKTSALFLGYLLIFTGALYILRIATAHYQLSVTSGNRAGSLDTSSPGLVMVTLGVALVMTAMLSKTSVEYGHTTLPAAVAQPATGGNPIAAQPGFGPQ